MKIMLNADDDDNGNVDDDGEKHVDNDDGLLQR